jgi:antitoxin component YwqK of YwqJK toxin-antitoxin module
MKKLLGIILLLSSTLSYGLFGLFEKTVCVETDSQERNGLVYLPNQHEPFTGKNLCKYKNGQIKVEGSYKGGMLDDKQTGWFENGQKELEVNFKDGNREGKLTLWSENGQKLFEENYKDGKTDGKFTWWNKNGQIKKEANFKDGKLVN